MRYPVLLVAFFLLCGALPDGCLAQSNSFIRSVPVNYASKRMNVQSAPDSSVWMVLDDSLIFLKLNSCGSVVVKRQLNHKQYRTTGPNPTTALPEGGIAWIGQRSESGSINPGMVLMVLDKNGNTVLSKQYHIEGQTIYPYSIHALPQGGFLVYGNSSPSAGNPATMVLKFDAAGQILKSAWSPFGGIWGGSWLLSNGNILIRTGSSFLMYNSNLELVWGRGYPISGSNYESPVELNGGIVLSGIDPSDHTFTLYKVDYSGVAVNESFRKVTQITDRVRFCSDGEGGLYSLSDKMTLKGFRPFLMHWDSELNLLSSRYLPFQNMGGQVLASDLRLDSKKRIIVSGTTFGTDASQPFIARLEAQGSPCLTDTTQTILAPPNWDLIWTVVSQNPNFQISQQPITLSFSTPKTTNNAQFFCGTAPQLRLDLGPDTVLCGEIAIWLKNRFPDDFDSYHWTGNQAGPELLVTDTGTFWLEALDGCRNVYQSDTIHISGIQFPIRPGFDSLLCSENPVELPGQPSGWKGIWENGLPGKPRLVNEPGKYTLSLAQNECSTRWDFSITECERFAMPTLLTSNYDGQNERLVPKEFRGLKPGRIRISNRWGKQVWESSRFPDETWTPTEVTDGLYFLMLETETKTGAAKTFSGWVQVMKPG